MNPLHSWTDELAEVAERPEKFGHDKVLRVTRFLPIGEEQTVLVVPNADRQPPVPSSDTNNCQVKLNDPRNSQSRRHR